MENGTVIHRIIGLVSFGFQCAMPLTPGFYAPIFPQLEWVKKVIKNTNQCPNLDSKCESGMARCSATKGKKSLLQRESFLLFYILAKNFFLSGN